MIPTLILLGLIAGIASVAWAQGGRRMSRTVAGVTGMAAVVLTLAFFVAVNGSAGIGSINFVVGAAVGWGLTAIIRAVARRTN